MMRLQRAVPVDNQKLTAPDITGSTATPQSTGSSLGVRMGVGLGVGLGVPLAAGGTFCFTFEF